MQYSKYNNKMKENNQQREKRKVEDNMHDYIRLVNHWRQPKSCLLIYYKYAMMRHYTLYHPYQLKHEISHDVQGAR